MRVWKTVGAVAIYNKWRAVAVVVLPLVAVGAVAFLVGLAADGGGGGDTAQANTTAATAPAPAGARAQIRQGYRRGYARGKRAGARAERRNATVRAGKHRTRTLVGTGRLRPGVYAVRVGGSNGTQAWITGRSVSLRPGFLYRVCSGGGSICERPGS